MTHLSDLCGYIKKVLRSNSTHDIAAEGFKDGDLSRLVQLCQGHWGRTSSGPQLKIIAELSYSVARSYNKSSALSEHTIGEFDRLKLLRLIRFVGRIRTCYETFLEAAVQFPSFQQFELIFIAPSTLASRVPRMSRIRFPEDFEGSHGTSVKNMANMKARYEALCAKRLHVHAEIGLLFHLLGNGSDLARAFRYIGISKLSCFLCHHMLLGVGIFRNRGCHGVLETQWTLPRSFDLNSDYCERVFSSFMKLQIIITKRSKTLKKTRIDRKPQSQALVSDRISMNDRLELAARMEFNSKVREDEDEARFWEMHDTPRCTSLLLLFRPSTAD